MTTLPPPPPQPAGKNGCWKWGVIGCLSAILIAILGVAGIVAIVFGAIRSSDAYRGALASAQKDPRVLEALGPPVEAGFWVKGNIGVGNQRGNADIEFPLIGSKSRGRLHAVATKSGGTWRYTELTVTPKNGPMIDLLSEPVR